MIAKADQKEIDRQADGDFTPMERIWLGFIIMVALSFITQAALVIFRLAKG